MEKETTQIGRLIFLYLEENLSQEEQVQLDNWLDDNPSNRKLFENLINEKVVHQGVKKYYSIVDSSPATLEKIIAKINDETIVNPAIVISHRVHFLKTAWFRYVAAILVLIGTGTYLFIHQQLQPELNQVLTKQDVLAPVNNRATLTLANGQVMFLDSVSNGTLASQADADIIKLENGDIVYYGKRLSGEMQYNVLSVPKGSQIASIVLSDGSKVYLNAASSIKYPVVFGNKERRIEIDGEAYLEVAKDKNKKFIVESKGTLTEVLGTSFNVNAFKDEDNASITLIDGSVKVTRDDESIVVTPGEQVLVRTDSKKLLVNHKANLRQVTAWQKGLFIFTDMSLPSILRQVERWYNVTLKYEGVLPAVSYTGGLSRNLPLSEVINLLQSEKIIINLKGDILTVKPK